MAEGYVSVKRATVEKRSGVIQGQIFLSFRT
jgi:hypothetical protein